MNSALAPRIRIFAMAKAASEQMNTPVGTLSTVRTSEFMKYVLMPRRQASLKFAGSSDRGQAKVPFMREVGRRLHRREEEHDEGRRPEKRADGESDVEPGDLVRPRRPRSGLASSGRRLRPRS